MNRSRSNSPVVIPVVLGICVLLVLISLASQTALAQGPLAFIFTPIQGLLSQAGRAVSNAFRPLIEPAASPNQIATFQKQITSLANENARLREFQAENSQLRDLLKFTQDNPALDFVGADVIGIGSKTCEGRTAISPDLGLCAAVIAGDPSPYVRFLTINAGSDDGVQVGMPVIGGGGVLIGRIGRVVNGNSAQVQLINDSSSFITVQLVGSRALGTIAGQADGTLRLQNVLQTETLLEGDLIVTSGLGGGLPPSLSVGQVDKLVSKELDTLKEATVRPGTDLRRIETVIVLKFVPPS